MARCAHCDVNISDPTTQVVHGDMTYCCVNCAQALEHGGSGAQPTGALMCTHCGTLIVDESSMVSRGDQAFCCSNCASG